MIGLKYLQCCSFMIPFYHINCFCNEITATFNITFENSLFTVAMLTFEDSLFTFAMLMIKSEIFRVRFPTKWQANSNVYINEMPWNDPLNGYFVELTACSKRYNV